MFHATSKPIGLRINQSKPIGLSCQVLGKLIGLFFTVNCYAIAMSIGQHGKMTDQPSKRDQIVTTAFRLFKANGFYATGVDLIMRQANVSKRTLYKYFPTKNELIVAVLEHYRATYQQHLDTLLNTEHGARDNIRAIFDDAKNWFEDRNFHGCLAVNAMGEFSGKDQAIETSCVRFKQWEIGVLRNLAAELDDRRADELAYKLFVLLEGMASIAQVNKGACPVDMTTMADEVVGRHLAERS